MTELLKIYTDDPNLPYKTTKLGALYSRSKTEVFWPLSH